MALLKNRHNPDVKDTYDRSPLWWAAENGHETVVKLLRRALSWSLRTTRVRRRYGGLQGMGTRRGEAAA
jgi:hypothetical protein